MKRTQDRIERHGGDDGLSMTAMIDVVFLLLVFFIMAARPLDVEAKLEASRPSGGGGDLPLLTIDVSADGYRMNRKPVDLEQMDRYLTRLGEISRTQSVIVTSTMQATHSRLIKVLDLCAKAELKNISLMSR